MTAAFHPDPSLSGLLDDQERLRRALLADAPHATTIEDSERSFLLRAITAQRHQRLIPNDAFETMLAAATSPSGRSTLLRLFGAAERVSA